MTGRQPFDTIPRMKTDTRIGIAVVILLVIVVGILLGKEVVRQWRKPSSPTILVTP